MAWARVDDGWWCHPKVMNLDLASKGLWITALSWSCAQRKDIVPDAFLRMISATNDEANALVRAGLWVALDDGYQIHDWAVYQDMSLSEKRAEAGRKGGIRSGEVRSQGKQTGSNDQPKAEAGTHPFPSLPIPTPTRAKPEPAPDGFAEWWAMYPRKQDKAEARKAYARALRGPAPRPTPADLVAGLDRSKAEWKREGRPWDKHPYAATWLNKRRWEDEVQTTPGSSSTGLNEAWAAL
jgi:hypothetical protein